MTNWTIIYNQWRAPMQRLAYRYLKDQQLAEDIVQDIFLRMLEKKISPAFMEHAAAYLKTAVYHRCMSCLRKKKASLTIDEWALQSNTTEKVIEYRELKRLHHQAIQLLPARQKEIYLLQHMGGYKREEISTLLGTSAKTIKKQLQTSNQKVRAALIRLRA